MKLTSIARPTDKIEMAEEPSQPSELPPPGVSQWTGPYLDDGRWEPNPPPSPNSHSLIGIRHNKVGDNANFCDGHAAATPWQWATNANYVNATP
jgi:hypothetical protein